MLQNQFQIFYKLVQKCLGDHLNTAKITDQKNHFLLDMTISISRCKTYDRTYFHRDIWFSNKKYDLQSSKQQKSSCFNIILIWRSDQPEDRSGKWNLNLISQIMDIANPEISCYSPGLTERPSLQNYNQIYREALGKFTSKISQMSLYVNHLKLLH